MALITWNKSIASSTTEDITLVAADTAGRKNKVRAVNLTFSGTITVQFKRGSTALGGAMEFSNGGSLVLGPEQCGGLQSAADESLVLSVARTSGSVRGNVDGVTDF